MFPNQPYANPAAVSYPTPTPALPKQNAGWVVAAIVFFWPLAFAAANHSASVYPLWAQGNYAGAQHASDRARKLGRIALLLAIAFLVLIFSGYVVAAAVALSSIGDVPDYDYGR